MQNNVVALFEPSTEPLDPLEAAIDGLKHQALVLLREAIESEDRQAMTLAQDVAMLINESGL